MRSKEVFARRVIAEGSGERVVLACGRALGGAHPRIILHAAIGALDVEIAGQGQVDRISRLPQQLAAQAQVALAMQIFVARDVVDRALARRGGRRQAQRDIVGQGPRGGGLCLNELVIAAADLDPGFGREARRARRNVERARCGVLAVERPLRAAENLDLRDIDEVEGRGADAADIDAVDIEADALLDTVVGQAERRAQTANVDRRVARGCSNRIASDQAGCC